MDKYEKSYMDMMIELHNAIETDPIPKQDKDKILNLIYELETLIEPYSA